MGGSPAAPRRTDTVWTLDHSQFAEIVAGVERNLERWPSHEQWHSFTVAF